MPITYREVRVMPVVRYAVQTIMHIEDDKGVTSYDVTTLAETSDVNKANAIAISLQLVSRNDSIRPSPVLETARALRIDWLRGPGEPKEAIHWELSEVEPLVKATEGDATPIV
jgi:hypothetical protein